MQFGGFGQFSGPQSSNNTETSNTNTDTFGFDNFSGFPDVL